MSELSPQAQAVLDSTMGLAATVREAQAVAAAALRAAADQVVPGDGSRRANEIRSEFLAIVTELENHQ